MKANLLFSKLLFCVFLIAGQSIAIATPNSNNNPIFSNSEINKKLCDFIIATSKNTQTNSTKVSNTKTNTPTKPISQTTQEAELHYNKYVIDSLIKEGADINCSCEVKGSQLKIFSYLGNNILNAFSRFFFQKTSRPLNERREVTYLHTPIFFYVGTGNRTMVDYLVQTHQADLNMICANKSYPLDIVVGHNNLEEVKWLVSLGASPKKTGLCTYNLQVFDWLLANGAEINQVNWNCLKDNEFFLVQVLQKYKPDLSQNADFVLPKSLSLKVLETFLSCGVKVDSETLMHYFTFRRSDELLAYTQIFAKYKVDFSECSTFGCPIEKALKTNDMRIIKLVAENGGLKTTRAICVTNPQHWEFLLREGLSIENIKVSCLFDEPKNLTLFIQKYKPDLSRYSQNTILQTLSSETLDILFAQGVKPTNDLLSYLFTFKSSGMYNYTQVFIKHKLSLENCGFFGCPFEKAIESGNLASVKLFVANGVDKNKPFPKGNTPLEVAMKKNQTEIVKYLSQ
jgi:hypothetical protein